MVKAYRVIEKTYVCGELENTYKCNKVLYTEAEAQEYNENHTYLYDTVEKIKEWHKKEFIDNFGARVKIIYPFFTSKNNLMNYCILMPKQMSHQHQCYFEYMPPFHVHAYLLFFQVPHLGLHLV